MIGPFMAVSGIDARYGDFRGGLDLSFFSSWYANLDYARFDSANLSLSDVNGSQFTHAVLSQTNLFGTFISESNLSDADLREADLTSAYLYNTNFTRANLSNTDFTDCFIDHGVDFTDAVVKGANFGGTNFHQLDLVSTASYKNHDLAGIRLDGVMLHDLDLSGQDMTGASLFGTGLTNCNLTDTDFSFADLRYTYGNLTGPILHNTIVPSATVFGEGKIEDLGLSSGDRLVIRDRPFSSSSILVQGSLALSPGSVLQLVLEDAVWASTLVVDSGVQPDLGGTLDLTFAKGVDAATLVGTTFHLFNWNHQLVPGDNFDQITSKPGFQWDTSHLHSDGDVTLLSVPEPTGWLLLALGGGAFGLVQLRRVRNRLRE